MSVTEKTKIGTIDMAPSWSAILPILLETYESNPRPGRREEALGELERMAILADHFVAAQKAVKAVREEEG